MGKAHREVLRGLRREKSLFEISGRQRSLLGAFKGFLEAFPGLPRALLK